MVGCRYDSSLGQLTKKFLNLINKASDGVLDLNHAADMLQVRGLVVVGRGSPPCSYSSARLGASQPPPGHSVNITTNHTRYCCCCCCSTPPAPLPPNTHTHHTTPTPCPTLARSKSAASTTSPTCWRAWA